MPGRQFNGDDVVTDGLRGLPFPVPRSPLGEAAKKVPQLMARQIKPNSPPPSRLMAIGTFL